MKISAVPLVVFAYFLLPVRKDPNFEESEMDKDVTLGAYIPALDKEEIDKNVKPLLVEYYENGELEECITAIGTFNVGKCYKRNLKFVLLKKYWLTINDYLDLGLGHRFSSHSHSCHFQLPRSFSFILLHSGHV